MKRPTRRQLRALGTLVLGGALVAAISPGVTSAAQAQPQARHVLLISIDGLHASDLAQCEANGACPNLAMLATHGSTYTNARTSEPSDSAPGLMGLVTGGDPKLTGVYYDDSYDRTAYNPPAQQASGTQDCSGPPGHETQYFENVDTHAPSVVNGEVGTRQIIGETVDPAQLPYTWQNGVCAPLYPNDFLRTNSIFSVAHAAGMRTAWADKHPVYNAEVAGHGTPNTVSDPFNTEINADIIPPSLVDTRGNTVTFPVANPDGKGPYFITDSVGDTESYDQIKVDAILNEIDGLNSGGTSKVGAPAIFGMNFQSVSVGQKLVDPFQSCVRSNNAPGCNSHYVPGGYEPGSLAFNPQLKGAIQFVDAAVGSMVNELRVEGLLASTTLIITAKHGQSPINSANLALIGHAEVTVLNNAGLTPAQVTDDDIALIWLNSPNQAPAAAAALQSDKTGANTAHIQYVLSGDALAKRYNSPLYDPRTPDLIVQPIAGTIYSSSTAKVEEHGGFSLDDTHVALLVVNGADLIKGLAGRTVTTPVGTYQVAPTVLAVLGLNPNALDSARLEGVKVLP